LRAVTIAEFSSFDDLVAAHGLTWGNHGAAGASGSRSLAYNANTAAVTCGEIVADGSSCYLSVRDSVRIPAGPVSTRIDLPSTARTATVDCQIAIGRLRHLAICGFRARFGVGGFAYAFIALHYKTGRAFALASGENQAHDG
jgi:hypothetical protein